MKNFLLKTWLILVCLLCGAGTMWATDYELVTSASQLVVGTNYIIADGTTGSVNVISTESNTNNRRTTTATVSNNKISGADAVMVFTLGGSSNAWTFTTTNYTGTNGFLYNDDTSNNRLKVGNNTTTNAFTISFSNNTISSITCNGNTSRGVMCFNGTLVACYSSKSSNYKVPQLYKEVSGGTTPGTGDSGETTEGQTKWELVTSAPSSWEGQYIIVAKPSAESRVLLNGAQTGFSSITPLSLGATEFSESNNILTISTDVDPYFTVTESTTSGQYNIKGSSGTWLGGSSSSGGFTNNKTNWVFEPKSDGKIWIRVYAASMTRAILYRNTPTFQHYATSNENSTGYGSVYLYKKYESGDPEKPTPSLSFENSIYNVTVGEGFKAPAVTNLQNVAVTYSSSDENVATVNSESGAVTIVAPGTTTITASFAGDETYNKTSASYNLVVAPAPLTTMDEIFAAATTAGSTATDCRVTFNNWVVSAVKNNNAYVTDNAGKGFIVYTSGHGFKVGNILSGTAACKVQLYRGSAELTTLTSSSEGLTVTENGVVTPVTSVALASLSGVNTGAVVSYENLQFDGENFTDGVTNLTPYNTLINLPNLVKDKNYNVTGIYVQYDETKKIAPRSEDDIELLGVLNKYIVTIETPTNGTLTIKNGETTINSGDEVEEGTFLAVVCEEASNDYRSVKWEYKAGEEDWIEQHENPGTFVMPSANVQFRATFELIPTYTVAWSVNGEIVKTETHQVGTEITAPKVDDIYGKKFTGWVTDSSVDADETPKYVTPIKVLDNVTYYAVFATQTEIGGTKYELVESALDNWAGDYLIVYNNTYAMKTHFGNQNANTYATYTDISDYYTSDTKSIASNSTTDNLVYRAAKTQKGYSLYSVSDKSYLGITANTTNTGARLRWNTSYTESADDWTLGVGSIGNVGSNTLYIRWNNNNSSYRFAAYTADGQQDIQLFKKTGGVTYTDYTTTPAPYTRNITNALGTLCLPYGVDMSGVSNVKFYTVACKKLDANGDPESVVFSEVVGNLEAGVPYVFKAETTPCTIELPYTGSAVTAPVDGENGLYGAFVKTPLANIYVDGAAEDFYLITNNTIKAATINGSSIGANRAYLRMAEVPEYGTAPASSTKMLVVGKDGFSLEDNGTITLIDAIATDKAEGEIYNLQGQRINRLQQGVNIVNGRKVIR